MESTMEKLRPREWRHASRPRVAWKGRPKERGLSSPPFQIPGECAGGPLERLGWQCPGLRGPCEQGQEVAWLGTQSHNLPSKASVPQPKVEDTEARPDRAMPFLSILLILTLLLLVPTAL